jgi:hypothetical protein
MRVFRALATAVVVAGCSNYGSTGTGSGDATLSALSLSAGALVPAFSSAVTAYAVTVPTNTTQLTVLGTTTNIYATMRVNQAIVASGTNSPAIALDVGTNLISVGITAENGTTMSYNITVTR